MSKRRQLNPTEYISIETALRACNNNNHVNIQNMGHWNTVLQFAKQENIRGWENFTSQKLCDALKQRLYSHYLPNDVGVQISSLLDPSAASNFENVFGRPLSTLTRNIDLFYRQYGPRVFEMIFGKNRTRDITRAQYEAAGKVYSTYPEFFGEYDVTQAYMEQVPGKEYFVELIPGKGPVFITLIIPDALPSSGSFVILEYQENIGVDAAAFFVHAFNATSYQSWSSDPEDVNKVWISSRINQDQKKPAVTLSQFLNRDQYAIFSIQKQQERMTYTDMFPRFFFARIWFCIFQWENYIITATNENVNWLNVKYIPPNMPNIPIIVPLIEALMNKRHIDLIRAQYVDNEDIQGQWQYGQTLGKTLMIPGMYRTLITTYREAADIENLPKEEILMPEEILDDITHISQLV